MAIDTFLRRSILTLIFAIPFLPLIVAPGFFFPFISGKNFAFRIIVELLLGLWLIWLLRSPEVSLRKSLLLWAFGIFVAVIALADVFGVAPYKSIWSNFERMEGLVTLTHLFFYFVVVGSVLKGQELWTRFFQTTLGASALLVGYSFLQAAGLFSISQSDIRVDATLGNATYLAAYLLFHIFLALFLMLRHRGAPWVRYVYGVLIVGQLVTLYLTATRGAMLGLLGGLIITALFVVWKGKNPSIKRLAFGGLAAIVLLIGGFLAIRNTEFVRQSPVLNRFASISLEETTTKSRFIIWGMVLDGFKERPILGWGQENFNYVFNQYYDPRMYNQEQWFDRTHNVVLDWLIVGGILGLLAYLSLFGIALYYLLFGDRRRISSDGKELPPTFTPEEKGVLVGLFAAYFFQNLFVFDNITSYILFVTFLAYLHSTYAASSRPLLGKLSSVAPGSREGAMIGVALLTLLLVYVVNVPAIRANLTLIKAVSNQQAGITKNLEYFNTVFAIDSFANAEAREQLMQAAFTVINQTARTTDPALLDVRQKFLALTDEQFKMQIAQVPNDARYRLFYGSFLNQAGRYQDGLVQLQAAEKLSPRKQTILFELGANALNRGAIDEALAYFKRAYELEPAFGEAKKLYLLGAVYAKRNDIVQQLNGNDLILDERFVRAYIQAGQPSGAVMVAEALVKANPNDFQKLLTLTAAYYVNGQTSKAVEVVRRMITLNPQFQAEGEAYIQALLSGTLPR